jgi:hypothetical protein
MLHETTILTNWIIAHKDGLLALVGGSAGLSALAQGVLHKIKVKWGVDSKAFSYTLVQVLTLIAALSAYLVDNANFGLVYPWLATAAAVIHRYAVSPYYTKKILPYLEFQASQAIPSQPQSQGTAPAAEVAPALL